MADSRDGAGCRLILLDSAAGEELVFPVTPPGYQITTGSQTQQIQQTGQGDLNLPGGPVLFQEKLEVLLPAQDYPFNQPGCSTNPWTYIEQLTAWSNAGTVLRFLVSGTPVNAAVLLDPIVYRERDGTGDLYCTVTLRRYRAVSAETAQALQSGQTLKREDGGAPTARPDTYVVKAGDTLSAICRQFYGDAALYGRLAAANGIANPHLIRVGQILKLPEPASLKATPAVQAAARTPVSANPPAPGRIRVSVSFSGADTYWGTCKMEWVEDGKKTASGVLRGVGLIQVPMGTVVTFLRTAGRTGVSDYARVDGVKTTAATVQLTVSRAEGHYIDVHWSMGNPLTQLLRGQSR